MGVGQTILSNPVCSFCNVESVTVGHFLLRCSKYQNIRTQTFNTLASHEPDFEHLNENDKLCYILDLRCSDINIGVCCNFVSKLYTQRGTDNMRWCTGKKQNVDGPRDAYFCIQLWWMRECLTRLRLVRYFLMVTHCRQKWESRGPPYNSAIYVCMYEVLLHSVILRF